MASCDATSRGTGKGVELSSAKSDGIKAADSKQDQAGNTFPTELNFQKKERRRGALQSRRGAQRERRRRWDTLNTEGQKTSTDPRPNHTIPHDHSLAASVLDFFGVVVADGSPPAAWLERSGPVALRADQVTGGGGGRFSNVGLVGLEPGDSRSDFERSTPRVWRRWTMSRSIVSRRVLRSLSFIEGEYGSGGGWLREGLGECVNEGFGE